MGMLFLVGLIIFFIGLAAFFAGSETGFMAVNKLALRHRGEKGDELSRLVLRMLEKPAVVLGTTLVGTNVSVVSATVLTNILLREHLALPDHYAHLLSTFGLTVVMLVFSEVIPKTIFQRRADELCRKVVLPLRFSYYLFWPISIFVSGFSHLLLFLFQGKKRKKKQSFSREDIELLAGIAADEGIISKNSQVYIHSVFSFGQTTTREIMTPLVDVVSIEKGKSINSVTRLIESSGFSRIPIYNEQAYDMVGYVSAFDLVHSKKRDTLKKFVRSPLFVPETKQIDSLLLEMRQDQVPMVFVVDEWGGTAGIITHEDIAEYVVGQIRDRGEKSSFEIKEVGSGEYLLDATMDIDGVSEKIGIDIEKAGFETAGGFVEYLMQRIPEKGDKIEYGGFQIIVEDATQTAVSRIRLIRRKPPRSSRRK